MDLVNVIRLLSVATTILIFGSAASFETARAFIYSLALGHYLIALWYSRKRISDVVRHPGHHTLLLLITAISALLYFYNFPLVLFFAVHHIFSEAYMENMVNIPGEKSIRNDHDFLRTAGIFLNLLIYLVILRQDIQLLVPGSTLILGLIVTAAVFLFFLNRLSKSLTVKQIFQKCSFELLGLIILASSFYIHISLIQIVSYHVVGWIFFPLLKMRETEPKKIVGYLSLTTALTATAFLMSPVGLRHYMLEDSFFQKQFYIWSYLHIALSFVVSDIQPVWIRRWFKPLTSVDPS